MKKTNKGFSLVELIIVIAIMAILAGAIAPALIRYIDKSRKSNDVSAAKTIKTAIETALGNEQIYEYLTSKNSTVTADTQVLVIPGKSSAGQFGGSDAVKIAETISATDAANAGLTISLEDCAKEIATNIGETMPRCKYKKAAADPKSSTLKTPVQFVATINPKGTVTVGVYCADAVAETAAVSITTGATINFYQLTPDLSTYYQ